MLFLPGKSWRGKGGKVMTFILDGAWYTLVYQASVPDVLEIKSPNKEHAMGVFNMWKNAVALKELPSEATKIKRGISMIKRNYQKRVDAVENMKNDPDVTVEEWQREVRSLEQTYQYHLQDLARYEQRLADCFYKPGERINPWQ